MKRQKAVFLFLYVFLVMGMMFNFPAVFAAEGDSASVSGDSNSETTADNSDSNDEAKTDGERLREIAEQRFEQRGERLKENLKKEFREDGRRVKIEREVEVQGDGSVKITIKRTIIDANGVERKVVIKIVEKDGERRVKIEKEDEEDDENNDIETDLEIGDDFEGNQSDLEAKTSDGKRHRIKVLPDEARKIIMERLNTLNISNLTLEEIRDGNIPRVIYNIQTNKHGRFLGVFKLAMKVDSQVDPTTGEVLDVNGPWWAILVVGGSEDSPDETLIDGKTKIKAETFNGTSEVKFKIEFGTESTDQGVIVQEILNRLNNASVADLLKVEESDEPLETEEKLEAKVKIKDKITKVEFELRFAANGDNREEIINAILARLSALTADDINNVLVLKTKDKNGDDEDEIEDEEDEDDDDELEDDDGEVVVNASA